MENPYVAPADVPLATDDRRRPVGVAIISIVTGILSLILLVAFIVVMMNYQENNQFAISRGIAPSLFYFFVTLSLVWAMAASIGTWRGRKSGWWLICTALVLHAISNVGAAVMANMFHGAPSPNTLLSVDSLKFGMRALICIGLLAYWLRMRVRQYFRLEKTGKFRAILLTAVCGIGFTAIVTFVLQSIFLLRTR